jgi:hypothetical protein
VQLVSDDGYRFLGLTNEDAQREATTSERVVPVHWPTLTDAERERVSVVADWASEHLGQDDPGVVALRALMERVT